MLFANIDQRNIYCAHCSQIIYLKKNWSKFNDEQNSTVNRTNDEGKGNEKKKIWSLIIFTISYFSHKNSIYRSKNEEKKPDPFSKKYINIIIEILIQFTPLVCARDWELIPTCFALLLPLLDENKVTFREMDKYKISIIYLPTWRTRTHTLTTITSCKGCVKVIIIIIFGLPIYSYSNVYPSFC